MSSKPKKDMRLLGNTDYLTPISFFVIIPVIYFSQFSLYLLLRTTCLPSITSRQRKHSSVWSLIIPQACRWEYKIIKAFTEYLPFLNHHVPVQNTPFVIMVFYHFFIARTPGTPLRFKFSPVNFL